MPIYSGLTLVTPPVAEPVSVADAKAHSRIFIDADDSIIAGYISSARNRCEKICKRAFLPQTWRYAMQHWPGRKPYAGYPQYSNLCKLHEWSYFEVPLPPFISVTSFTYQGADGTIYNMTQSGFGNTVGNYLINNDSEPAKICLPFAGIWPTTVLLPPATAPIKITYQCGYPLFQGTLRINAANQATFVSGSAFDPLMVGKWLTVTDTTQVGFPQISFAVLSQIDSTTLQLSPPYGSESPDITNPLSFICNGVPQNIVHAILFLAGHFYENRETVLTGRSVTAIEIPQTVDDLLASYRIHMVGPVEE